MQDVIKVRPAPDGKRCPAKSRPHGGGKPLVMRVWGASARGLARRLQPRDQLVQAQLLEALSDGLQLACRVLDQLAALTAQVERLAQAWLARVQLLDDLLDAVDRRLVGCRLHGHRFTSSRTRAGRVPSAMRSSKSSTSRTAAALASGSPSGP